MAQPETVQRRDAKMHALHCPVRPSTPHTVRSFYAGSARPCLMQSLTSPLAPAFLCHSMSGGRSSRLPRRKTPAGFLDDAWRKGKARKAMHHAPPKVLAVRSRRDDR